MKTKRTKGWGESIDEVLKLKTAKDGAAYVSKELRRLRRQRADWKALPYKKAKALYLSNMGYMAGYYGPRQARKILTILATEHPVFGKM